MHIDDLIEDSARDDGGYAVAFALLRLAKAQERTARALERLGLDDARTPMGAVELLSSELKRLADAVERIAWNSTGEE